MTDRTIEMAVLDHHDPADHEAILGPLIAFNFSKIGIRDFKPLAILLKDPDRQETVGGLWGESYYDWLFVELLFVPEFLRGQGFGKQLMAEAETVARSRGCAGIWIDTFEFQARGFYEKLGYTLFGTIEDYPRGINRFFLKKRIDTP
jgi:GNAT superfamily N-acetyltransferase